MSRIFIAIAIIFLVFSILIAEACFLASRDTLTQFVPQGTSFYLHFNFNPLNSQGQIAEKYFSQNWPRESLDHLLIGQWAFIKNYFNQDKIGQIDELAITIVDNQPILLMKYKANFANFMPLVLNQEGANHYQFLTPTVFVASNQKSNLDKIKKQPSRPWSQFKNVSFRSFANGRLQDWSIKAKLVNKGLDFYALNDQRTANLNLSEKINQFLAYTIAAPKTQEEYVYLLPDQAQITLEQIQNIFQKNLAFMFPINKPKILPDKTSVNEIIADPTIFKFQSIIVNGQNAYELNIKQELSPIFLALRQKNILFSNNQILLGKFLEQPLTTNFNEAFYWQNKAIIIQGQAANSSKNQAQNSIHGLIYFK
jgi:hypothetical protein